MRRLKVGLLCLILGLLCMSVSGDAVVWQWYKCLLHVHGPNSDGLAQLEDIQKQAQKQGVVAVFMTDHNTCFGTPGLHPGHRHLAVNPYSDFVEKCQELSKNNGLPMIPGVECSLTDAGLKRHVLVLGLDEKISPPFDADNPASPYWYPVYRPGVNEAEFFQVIAEREKAVGHPIPVIIAHPSLWEPAFDVSAGLAAKRAIGVEIFNDVLKPGGAEEADLALGYSLADVTVAPKGVYYVAGNDSHILATLNSKFTHILAEALTKDALVSSLGKGWAYATNHTDSRCLGPHLIYNERSSQADLEEKPLIKFKDIPPRQKLKLSLVDAQGNVTKLATERHVDDSLPGAQEGVTYYALPALEERYGVVYHLPGEMAGIYGIWPKYERLAFIKKAIDSAALADRPTNIPWLLGVSPQDILDKFGQPPEADNSFGTAVWKYPFPAFGRGRLDITFTSMPAGEPWGGRKAPIVERVDWQPGRTGHGTLRELIAPRFIREAPIEYKGPPSEFGIQLPIVPPMQPPYRLEVILHDGKEAMLVRAHPPTNPYTAHRSLNMKTLGYETRYSFALPSDWLEAEVQSVIEMIYENGVLKGPP